MDKLISYANDWRNAPIESSDYITPDDGKYRVIIEDVTYSERDKEGNGTYPTFTYTFRITEGENKEMKFRRFSSIRNEKSAGFIKGDLQKLGMPIPANVEELPELFQSAAGAVIDVTVKTREVNGKPYKDIYIDRLIGRQQVTRRQPQQPQQAYQPPKQFADARPQGGYYAQRPQYQQQQPPQAQGGYYAQRPQYQQQQPPQAQAFGAEYNQNDDIPF